MPQKRSSNFVTNFFTHDYFVSAPLIEIFSGTSFIAMRSMVSKLVDRDELGKIIN